MSYNFTTIENKLIIKNWEGFKVWIFNVSGMG
jgi:hypothetical protein